MAPSLDRFGGARGLVAGGAVGIVVGGALGWFAREPRPDTVERESSGSTREVAARYGETAPPHRDDDRGPPDPAAGATRAADFEASDRSTFDAELARRGHDGIVAGWAQVRRDAMPDELLERALARFQSDVEKEPERLGRDAAERRTKQEAAALQGPAFLELEKMNQGEAVDRKLADDPERFDALFERRSGAITLDGTEAPADLQKKVADGATIMFPAGVFQIDLASVLQKFDRRPAELPRDLTIAGAGIDRTLLVSENGLRLSSRVRDWTFRDCTLFGDDELISCMGDSSLTLDRIRVIGFDCGAGGSSALFLMANVLRCRDSIFEGGYGRSPAHGNLLDVRSGAMLARFERCRFVELAISHTNSSWRIAFDGCRFEELIVYGGGDGPGFPPNMATTDCTFTILDTSSAQPTKKDLKTLFPDYGVSQGR